MCVFLCSRSMFMKGDVKVIEFFNKVFYNELIVIN